MQRYVVQIGMASDIYTCTKCNTVSFDTEECTKCETKMNPLDTPEFDINEEKWLMDVTQIKKRRKVCMAIAKHQRTPKQNTSKQTKDIPYRRFKRMQKITNDKRFNFD